jgi:translation initiation factor 2B subunit (eIF-2B alpha/beta/delta family)
MDFSHILNDRESGSIALLNRVIDAIDSGLQDADLNAEEFCSLLQDLRKQIDHFAAIENFLVSLIRHTGESKNFPVDILQFLRDYRSHWQDSDKKITENFLQHCDPGNRIIFTHSHSETVISLLKQLKGRSIPFLVLQSLSSPGEEGRLSMERMHKARIRAELIDDTDILDALVHTDIILMGCDALLPLEFLNKVGTRAILEEAKKLNKQSLLVTESRKKITRSDWKNELSFHALFEWVPLYLVDRIVSEKD